MDKPIFSVEQRSAFITGDFDLKMKGDPKDVIGMLAYAMDQVPDVAYALLSACGTYLSNHPLMAQEFKKSANL
jgi:hypothetical protein